jgi:two-component system LytT family response regulator
MIKAIIIDDEPLARSIIAEYLQDNAEIKVAAECSDGFEGVKAIGELKPDLIFLDVQMPKLNGFEMLELLDSEPAVIFTTAFDEYAMKAFEAHAIDYLLKPFSKDRFGKAIDKMKQGLGKTEGQGKVRQMLGDMAGQPLQSGRVAVKTGAGIRIIPMNDIHYLEAYDDYVKIHTSEGVYLKKKTMGHFEATCDSKQFVRVHRSFMVQLSQITRIEPYEKDGHILILKSGEKIPVSKTGYPKLKTILGI